MTNTETGSGEGQGKRRFPSEMTNTETGSGEGQGKRRFPSGMTNGTEVAVVRTSAVEGRGIEELRRAILEALRAVPPSADTLPVTNLRQHGAVTAALAALGSAQAGISAAVPHEMQLLDLHECLDALDALTGTTHTEEILGVIFSSFCIGK
jgi:tRNA modification GTPase